MQRCPIEGLHTNPAGRHLCWQGCSSAGRVPGHAHLLDQWRSGLWGEHIQLA